MISVVMCTYNGAKYLSEQLESVLHQTLPADEILIQDDGSTDGTWSMLEQYARRYPQIRLLRNGDRHGINGNFISALHKSKGDFIAVCDQDDIWELNKLERQMQTIGNRLMCGAFSQPFSSDGSLVKWDDRQPCLHALRLCYLSEVPGHVQLFRRELLRYLPSAGRLTMLYDWQLQFIASVAENITFLPVPLVRFRRHAQAATYAVPVSNTGWQGVRTFFFLWQNYAPLHGFFKQRLQEIKVLLADLERLNPLLFDTESMRLVRQFIELQQKKSFVGYLRLTFFCMKHHDKLFHAVEPKHWKSVLRAIYWPMYGLNYYRGIILSEE